MGGGVGAGAGVGGGGGGGGAKVFEFVYCFSRLRNRASGVFLETAERWSCTLFRLSMRRAWKPTEPVIRAIISACRTSFSSLSCGEFSSAMTMSTRWLNEGDLDVSIAERFGIFAFSAFQHASTQFESVWWLMSRIFSRYFNACHLWSRKSLTPAERFPLPFFPKQPSRLFCSSVQ